MAEYALAVDLDVEALAQRYEAYRELRRLFEHHGLAWAQDGL